jgi:hypothetical protein
MDLSRPPKSRKRRKNCPSTTARGTRLDDQRYLQPVLTTNQYDASTSSLTKRDDTDPSLLYPAHNISVPVDHFHNETQYAPHSNATFNLRYWFDATYYKPGGPVIVLQSGETSGVGRLGFLQKGLLHQLANLTNGVGVVLEHRYVCIILLGAG